MSKSPAFLFYPGDFTGGTLSFTREEKGAYLELLILQFNKGSISEDDIKRCFGVDFEKLWNFLCEKFLKENDGKYFNKRLREEMDKRSSYSLSRKKNRTYVKHMENEIENRKLLFKEKVCEFLNEYPAEMLRKFIDYWTEHNEGGKKMRYEKQPTFDIKLRLNNWSKNELKFKSNATSNDAAAKFIYGK